VLFTYTLAFEMSENNQTKSNARGGKRSGAGRKAGAATKKTRVIADKAAAEGVTPLEVMLKTMVALMAKADEIAKLPPDPDGKPAANPLDLMIEAAGVAKDAAPYMHPRLAAMELSGKNGQPLAPVLQVVLSPEKLEEVARRLSDEV
jgi:hypothetical protein